MLYNSSQSLIFNLFATLDSTEEAFDYALEVLGTTPQTITALMVYRNTMIEEFIENIKEKVNGV